MEGQIKKMNTNYVENNIVKTISIIRCEEFFYKAIINNETNKCFLLRSPVNEEGVSWIPPRVQACVVIDGEVKWVPLLTNTPDNLNNIETINEIITADINKGK